MSNGDNAVEYLLSEVDALIKAKERDKPDYTKCPVSPTHAQNEAEASLLQLKMLRISTNHAMKAKHTANKTWAAMGTGFGTVLTAIAYIMAKIHGVVLP